MTKYKQYLEKMLSENKQFFDSFKMLHDKYALNPLVIQSEYNGEGEKALEIIHDYENRLCANTERGIYNKFSGNLSEKFQAEVKKVFPMIDHIGLIVENPQGQPVPAFEEVFSLKKIEL